MIELVYDNTVTVGDIRYYDTLVDGVRVGLMCEVLEIRGDMAEIAFVASDRSCIRVPRNELYRREGV